VTFLNYVTGNVLTYCQEKITRFKNDNYMLPQIENGRFYIKNERWATQSQLTEPLVIQIISLITGKMVAGQARAMETTSSEDNFLIICRYLNLVKNQRIYCFSSCPKYLPPLCMYVLTCVQVFFFFVKEKLVFDCIMFIHNMAIHDCVFKNYKLSTKRTLIEIYEYHIIDYED
jgi:hypothetical protein